MVNKGIGPSISENSAIRMMSSFDEDVVKGWNKENLFSYNIIFNTCKVNSKTRLYQYLKRLAQQKKGHVKHCAV